MGKKFGIRKSSGGGEDHLPRDRAALFQSLGDFRHQRAKPKLAYIFRFVYA